MGRKRKRVRASAAAAGNLGGDESRPAATPSAAAAAAAATATAAAAAAAGAGAAATVSSKPTISSLPSQQQHPDRRRKLPAGGGGGDGRGGGGRSSNNGKVQRIGRGASTAADAPTVLVVGLDPLEQLSFVGAALVRCGRGQADLSGYTLLPIAWGPYVEAHSPRWMSLLVVRALETEEYLDASARDSSGRDRARGDDGDGDGDGDGDDEVENEIEEAIDRIAEDFPVVVVFKSLLGSGPLAFMSAQADADALYFPELEKNAAATTHQELQAPGRVVGGGGKQEDDAAARATAGGVTPVVSGGTGDVQKRSCEEEPMLSPALRLAADLHLPGMQVVVTESAGLRPFSVSRGWSDAVDAVLATPTPSTGSGSGPVLVCGAKGVGKSSLCRFLVNRALGRHRQVSYMDCDLGQP
ncbi:unnamed protein product, partial [Hapterophycus canaliculatus]